MERTLRLVEIQQSVLPEDEYIMGITDLSYFKGIGFSMPVSFDDTYFVLGEDPLLRGGLGHSDICIGCSDEDDISFEAVIHEKDPLLTSELEHSGLHIGPHDRDDPKGLHPDIVEDELLFSMGTSWDKKNLFAFIPGVFYCSSANTAVDGILIEVSQKEMLGMELSSFRTEAVRSYDISRGISVDDTGKTEDIEMSMSEIGQFKAGLSASLTESLMSSMTDIGVSSYSDLAFSRETEVAKYLSEMFPLDDLKRAYVSDAILIGQMMTLLHDIETNGLYPRFKIYIRNTRYPKGHVVDIRYRTLDSILHLGKGSGIECPSEVDIELQMLKLSFAKLIGDGKEVDIESAIIDIYGFLFSKLAYKPSKHEIMKLIFQEGIE
ncbi:MAG: hypothetical protein ACTSUB_04940 [Candidatus Thorarchaeota archaeon]